MRTPRVAAAILAVTVVLVGCGPPPGAGSDEAGSSEASPSGARSSAPTAPEDGGAGPGGESSAPAPSAPQAPATRSGDLPSGTDRGAVLGADISWPQCPRGTGIPQRQGQGQPMPVDEVEYVILGLTNGPGFYPNPCLADQLDWVRERDLLAAAYAVISYPEPRHLEAYGTDGPFDGATPAGRLRNAGYAQARFNIETIERVGLTTPIVWLDVEPVSDFEWTEDTAANAAVVQGSRRAYEDAGYATGVYSTAYMWREIVGDLRLGLPEWRPAGATSRQEALRRCGEESMIQGGHAVLAQWVERSRDMNLTCPGTSVFLEAWFSRQ